MCFISMLDLSKEDIEAIIEDYKKRNKTETYSEDIDDILVIKSNYDYENRKEVYIN